jgi:hypothetical protein
MISPNDSNRFAALSGDFNPLHIDPIAARRMIFGSTTPHGVHIAMRAIDQALSSRSSPARFAELRCNFASPATHDKPLEITWESRDDGALKITVTQYDSTILTAELKLLAPGSSDDPPIADAAVSIAAPLRLAFDEMEGRTGSVPLTLDRSLLHSLFPAIARLLPVAQIAVLLATTRIVGMECPGLRSVFGDLKLEFEYLPPDLSGVLAFRAVRADRRMSLVQLLVSGGGANGEITAFLRPDPVAQARAETVAREVVTGEFKDQRALVIGGSRGLGEITAKLLAMGGADVLITYLHGGADAERIVRDISEKGGRCDSLLFDVTSPPDQLVDDGHLGKDWQPTHIYYFASGPIQSTRARDWSDIRFRGFCDFYVGGLARCFASLKRSFAGLDVGPLGLFYPSTMFIDKPQSGFAEYAAAKAAGEVICRTLAKKHPNLRIWCPRLPPLKTDQTNSLRTSSGAADPLPVILDLLRGLA